MAHKTGRRQIGGLKYIEFQTIGIAISRLPTGSNFGFVACPVCQKELPYRVSSIAATKIRRAVWLTLGLLLLLAFAVSIYTIATWGTVEEVNGVATNEPPYGLLFAGIVGGLLGSLICLSAWWTEDGVGGPGRWLGIRHGLMYRMAFEPALPAE